MEGYLLFILSEKFLINIFRDMGNINCIQLQDIKQGKVKGILAALPISFTMNIGTVKAFLNDFNVIITKVPPEEIVNFASGGANFIFV